MQLHIPCLGEELRLTKDWAFKLYLEYRNRSLWDLMNPQKWHDIPWQYHKKLSPSNGWLPAGTVLTVDRVFIRKGSREYDSITFRAKIIPYSDGVVYPIRFWVRLEDANLIEFEEVK